MSAYRGLYSDGRSAAREEVEVRLDGPHLSVHAPSGAQLAAWPYADLKLVEEVYPGQPVRLTSKTDKGARLAVTDTRILGELKAVAPRVGAGNRLDARTAPRALAWAGTIVVALAGLYFALPYMAGPVARLVPPSWEEAWGEAMSDRALTVFAMGEPVRLCTNPEGRAALKRLTQRLAGTVKSPYTFRVRVVDTGMVNAFAAPGGHIVLFRGLIETAKSSDEVAGVLAHEMGHVIERHSTQAVVRALGLSAIISALVGDTSSVASDIADLGSALVTLSYNRSAEAEADRSAIRMLNRANIKGTGLAAFFARAAGRGNGNGIAKYISTHPPSGARARAAVASSTGTDSAMPRAEWLALREICKG